MANDSKLLEPYDYLGYHLVTNIQSICRICLEKSNKLTAIFDPIKPPHFSILLMTCSNIQVINGDGLPPHICQKCISKLNLAFHFKTQCESADTKLRQSLENYKNLLPATHGKKNCNKIPDKEIQSGDGSEILETFKTSDINNPKIESTDNDQDNQFYETKGDGSKILEIVKTSDGNNPKIESLDNDQNNQVHETNFSDTDDLEMGEILEEKTNRVVFREYIDDFEEEFKPAYIKCQSEQRALQPTRFSKPRKIHQCDSCGKIFKSKPSLVHHIRIHTGERPYVCHLCEKRFINGGHLHTHMKSHTGEKNHICVACNKAFTTSQQLTKHTIAIHTSQRPYGCTYCTKRFASSSNLNTHLKIHTGERNYHCEVCGKKFATKGQLFQHNLVHTGEKAFLCEFCNKRFTQKAHLTRHLKTHKS